MTKNSFIVEVTFKEMIKLKWKTVPCALYTKKLPNDQVLPYQLLQI